MEGRNTLLSLKKKLFDYLSKHYKFSKQVLDAFNKIAREKFVLENWQDKAYDDNALAIVAGQTISQPSTILYMLNRLELKQGQKVLEIGAGSGYNAALIASIVGSKGEVISLEYLDEVAKFARKNIKKAGIKNVRIIKGDGSKGYSREAPYDRIIVTAACPNIPGEMIEQLKPAGIVVAPVGSLHSQRIVRIKKKDEIIEREESELEYIFVPLRGEHGFS